MKLLSINVGVPRTIDYKDKTVTTGIFKSSVSGPVLLRTLNLEGDGQADLENHGGSDKAVYAYTHDHYEFWARDLNRNDFTYGQFGENLTVEGMPEDQICIGDRFQIGEAVLEVSQPRVPCFKLAIRMNLPDFPKRFLKSGRSGFYLRVIREGVLASGDSIQRISVGEGQLSVRAILNLFYFDQGNLDLARRAFGLCALSSSWRDELAELLKRRS